MGYLFYRDRELNSKFITYHNMSKYREKAKQKREAIKNNKQFRMNNNESNIDWKLDDPYLNIDSTKSSYKFKQIRYDY